MTVYDFVLERVSVKYTISWRDTVKNIHRFNTKTCSAHLNKVVQLCKFHRKVLIWMVNSKINGEFFTGSLQEMVYFTETRSHQKY